MKIKYDMIRVTIVPRISSGRVMNGVTRYLLGIISYADPAALDIDLRILHCGHEAPAQEWLERFPTFKQSSNRVRKLNEDLLHPLALYRSRSSVVHYPLGKPPRGWVAGSAAKIVTLHGTARLTGSWRSAQHGKIGKLEKHFQSNLSQLTRVVTVSQWSKQRIIKDYGLQPEQITVIPNGVDLTCFRPLPPGDGTENRAWLETLGIQEPYLLYVGPCNPRKNTLRLVQAFGYLKQRQRIPHQLVLAGAPGRHFPTVKSEIARLGLTSDVILTGAVSDASLLKLYNCASVFVFPSLFEGFGLPVLEAMACGTPVVTSNRSALPETAGGAAALVDDPGDAEKITSVIQQVLEDAVYQESLRQHGLARAQEFRWETCATAHLELYRRVAQESEQ